MNSTIKKNLLGVISIMISLSSFAQISTCAYYDGYWGQWKKHYSEYTGHCSYKIYGNYSGFIVYYSSSHPSEYILKFQIDSYTPPTKDLIKYHYKNNIWHEYSGYVEYFIDSSYPTIKSALKSWTFAFVSNRAESIKKTARATVKIAPYKKHPKVYNLFFEDVAIAIDLGDWRFSQ